MVLCGVASSRPSLRRAQPGQRLHVPQVIFVRVVAPSVASMWNGASFRSASECTGQQ